MGALAVNHVAVSVPKGPVGSVENTVHGIEALEAYLQPEFVHSAYQMA